jgi:hypothetical protein
VALGEIDPDAVAEHTVKPSGRLIVEVVTIDVCAIAAFQLPSRPNSPMLPTAALSAYMEAWSLSRRWSSSSCGHPMKLRVFHRR